MKKWQFILIIFCFCLNCKAYAQQTIFNVPSADVTEKGHVFLQEEAQFNAWAGQNDNFYLNTAYGAYGIGHNTELDATLFGVSAPDTPPDIALGVGFKSAIPIPVLKNKFPKREYKFVIGSEMLIGLEGNGVGNWTYAELSGRLPVLNTRLTGGVSYGGRQVFGINTVAFIAGVEQPITKKFELQADWYSGGEHFAGFLIAGFNYKFPKNTTLYAGYQIPNTPRNGTPGFVIQLAKIF